MMSKEKVEDVAFVLGPDGHGRYDVIRRDPDNRVHFGTVTQVKEGQPFNPNNELINISPPNEQGICNVKSLYKPSSAERKSSGPAQVATDAYRVGWDNIFGSKTVGNA